MNKWVRIVLFVIGLPFISQAQKVDYNAIIMPTDAKDIPIAEKLVQLAWNNNPANQMLSNQVNAAQYDVKIARRSFLSQIGASGNLNEYTINPPADQAFPLFYPRYNFSASLNLGNFFTDPIKAKKAKELAQVATQTVNSQKLIIRAEVLRKYQEYTTNSELLKVQAESLEDASTSFSLVEQKFKNGQVNIVEFNAALENYNMRKTQKILADRDFLISKINLEELIGVKLEDIL